MKATKPILFMMITFAVLAWGMPDAAFSFTPELEDRQEGFLEDIPDWQARLELARLLSYTERYEESVSQYKKILQQKPDQMDVRIELARVLFWKGDLAAAEKVFSSVPENELSAGAKLEIAEIYVARGDYELAIGIYSDHLDNHPADHAVRLKLAQVLSWTGDYEHSAEEFKAILEEKPDDIQVRRKYAQVLIWWEQFDQAIIELEKTLTD